MVGEAVDEREGESVSNEADVARAGLALPRLRRGSAEAVWIGRRLRTAGDRAVCSGRLVSGGVAAEPSFGSEVWRKSKRLVSTIKLARRYGMSVPHEKESLVRRRRVLEHIPLHRPAFLFETTGSGLVLFCCARGNRR